MHLPQEQTQSQINETSRIDSNIVPLLISKDLRSTLHLKGIFHLESPRRIKAILRALEQIDICDKWVPVPARYATKEELALVHSKAYIDLIENTAKVPLTSFDLDTQASEYSYDAARIGIGGMFNLLDKMLATDRHPVPKRGFVVIRPPGHHALIDKAMGFCLFNNIAIAARYLIENYNLRRILIVDIDAHHGNGVQDIFYKDNQVLYISFHRFPAYPGTGNFGETGEGKGAGYTINVPLETGYGDKDLAKILYTVLRPVAETYLPEIILVACGFDLYRYDRMGGMNISEKGYGMLTHILIDLAQCCCNGKIVFIMEGGYNLKGIRECGHRVFQELCNISMLSPKVFSDIYQCRCSKFTVIKKVAQIHRKYWPLDSCL